MTAEIAIKILGALLLMLSAIYFSYAKISASRKRIIEVAAFIDMITEVKNSILHFSKPIPEIFASYNNEYFEKEGLIECIKTQGAKTAIQNYQFAGKNEIVSVVTSLFNKLGDGYTEEAVNLCSYTLEKLSDIRDRLTIENKNAEKLYRSLPILAVLSVILILI